MKSKFPILLSALLVVPLHVRAAERDAVPASQTAANVPAKVLSFCADKERPVEQLATRYKLPMIEVVSNYFDAAKKGDWGQALDLYPEITGLLRNSPEDKDQKTLEAVASTAVLEVRLAFDQFIEGEPKYALAFGNDIVASLPRGSVYFGGTDPGRGLPTALCASHEKADPAFVLTQNALADGRYLTYLRTMYGDRISTPTEEDSSATFQEYLEDAQRRLDHDERFPNEPRQLKPGENVTRKDNRVNVSGQVAVMGINGLLAKMIFDRNPDREFFVEESYPFEWMYPYLSPHGLVLKINRKPLTSISAEEVEKDRNYWLTQQQTMIGSWLKPETSMKEVCAFADKVFGRRDLTGFTGDSKFVEKELAPKMYSKVRSSIAGVYAWRAKQAKSQEKARMLDAADFAFRQSLALGPTSPGVMFRYVNFLVEQKRLDDALLVAETVAKIGPANRQIDDLVREIQRMQKR